MEELGKNAQKCLLKCCAISILHNKYHHIDLYLSWKIWTNSHNTTYSEKSKFKTDVHINDVFMYKEAGKIYCVGKWDFLVFLINFVFFCFLFYFLLLVFGRAIGHAGS